MIIQHQFLMYIFLVWQYKPSIIKILITVSYQYSVFNTKGGVDL